MEPQPRVQIHQYNDPEILEFLNEHHVQYRLLGDHLFVIRCSEGDVGAGPGDWLTVAVDGDVEVKHGDQARRAWRAILTARRARARRLPATAQLPRRP